MQMMQTMPIMPTMRNRLDRLANISRQIALISGMMVCALPAYGQNADPLTNIEQKRDETNQALEALSSEAQKNAALLEKLQTQIALYKRDEIAIRKLMDETLLKKQRLDAQIQAGSETLNALERDGAKLRLSLRDRQDILAQVLAALQRLGSNPPPALLVRPEDALSSVRSAILLGSVVPELRGEVENLLSDMQQLAQIRSQILAEREDLRQALDDIASEEDKLASLLQEKAELNIVSLQQLERERQRASELNSKSDQLNTIINSLNEEIQSLIEEKEMAKRLEEERQQRAEKRRELAQRLAEQGQDGFQDLVPNYAFSVLKDTLKLPVDGDVEVGFGDSLGAQRALDGILMSSQSDASVVAPVDGWVVFSGPFRSYGNLIILNAGEGYHLILAGMDQLKVAQGEFVLAGEPIAQMGSVTIKSEKNNTFALASGKPTLYIELRKDKKIIDSTPWWGALRSGRASNDT